MNASRRKASRLKVKIVRLKTVPEVTFAEWFQRKHGTGHTWPELVAAELARQESGSFRTPEEQKEPDEDLTRVDG
jgi:hypothetical protein